MSGCSKDEGLSPWLQFLPENCNALAGHQLWCGKGRFFQRDLRVKALLSPMGWPERLPIGFWPRARVLTDSPSSISSSALRIVLGVHTSPFLLVSLCLEFYSTLAHKYYSFQYTFLSSR